MGQSLLSARAAVSSASQECCSSPRAHELNGRKSLPPAHPACAGTLPATPKGSQPQSESARSRMDWPPAISATARQCRLRSVLKGRYSQLSRTALPRPCNALSRRKSLPALTAETEDPTTPSSQPDQSQPSAHPETQPPASE